MDNPKYIKKNVRTKAASTQKTKMRKKVFISWSGDHTREFAQELKKVLEDRIFKEYDLECFFSTQDIDCGTSWRKKIQNELRECKVGIICITKSNVRAPWLYMEAGAMIARGINTIPLLLDCENNILQKSPFSDLQTSNFHKSDDFYRMLNVINAELELGCAKSVIKDRYLAAHADLTHSLEAMFERLNNSCYITEEYIYPNKINSFNAKTVFMSVPMASVDSEEYSALRTEMKGIRGALEDIGFKEVICQILDIETQDAFEGKLKAIRKSFKQMKQVESMVVIYPRKIPSSVLVEVGYGIALSKKVVIFFQEGLPFVLQGVTDVIRHVRTYEFKEFEDIRRIILDNEMELFE